MEQTTAKNGENAPELSPRSKHHQRSTRHNGVLREAAASDLVVLLARNRDRMPRNHTDCHRRFRNQFQSTYYVPQGRASCANQTSDQAHCSSPHSHPDKPQQE